jgi:putative FmdB family regulatory protein
MPTYEYRCNACGREFEYQQRMSDDDLVTCEACNEPKLEKLISRTAFQLKGGGWYKDLYSSTKPAESTKDTKDSGTPASTTSSDKAADKPAAKADGASSSSSDSSSSGTTTTSAPAAAAPSTPKPSSTP